MHYSEYSKKISDYNRDMRRTITTDQLDGIAERFDEARQYIRLSGWVIGVAFLTGIAVGALIAAML